MRDAGIFDGDIVVIDKSLHAKDGDYVVAFLDGEFTVKEFRLDIPNHCAWLLPHNSQYHPIRIGEDNEFIVWGVVTHTIHTLRCK